MYRSQIKRNLAPLAVAVCLFDICREHGLAAEEEPDPGNRGRGYLEKNDRIIQKQRKGVAEQEAAIIESCFDPILEPPADFIEEWYRDHKPQNPFSCKLTRRIESTWYIVETECDGAEPLPGLMRRMIFSDREAV